MYSFKKRFGRVVKAFIFLFSVTVLSLGFNLDANAKSNINLGSQGTNDSGGVGTSGTWWKTGDYGVRFTLIKRSTGERISRSIDYYKLDDFKSGTVWHTGGNNKLEYVYLKNKEFSVHDGIVYVAQKGGYAFQRDSIWNVITTSKSKKTSTADIKKKYLSSETFLSRIARDMGGGISLETIRSKENRLVFEPIYYFHLDGKYYALTATEIALYDIKAALESRKTIRSGHVSFSHKAIPLAAYLKKAAYNIPQYAGAARNFTNEEILAKMGIGMLGGKRGEKQVAPKIKVKDYTYRVDSDVYTSVMVTAGNDATPENPISATFSIPGIGNLVTDNIYMPKGKQGLAYVRWRTPSSPREMDIKVTVSQGGKQVSSTLTAEIEKKMSWEPLNPKADDTKPINLKDFDMNFRPEESTQTDVTKTERLLWTEWDVEYQPKGDFIGWESAKAGSGKNAYVYYFPKYDELPYYSFGKHEYAYSYSPNGDSVKYIVNGRIPAEPKKYTVAIDKVEMSVVPAGTASRANRDSRYIKSGYGIEADTSVSVKGNGVNYITEFQNIKYFFPEFNYKKYWRWGNIKEGKKIGLDELQNIFRLPQNFYSYTLYKGTSEGRFHFLPIWYPDGIYDVYAELMDCWTPAGELRTNVVGEITVKGALWDDWHIQPGR